MGTLRRARCEHASGLVGSVHDMTRDFARQDFSGADLRGRTFVGAQLQHAVFRGTNLHGVNLQEADIRGGERIFGRRCYSVRISSGR